MRCAGYWNAESPAFDFATDWTITPSVESINVEAPADLNDIGPSPFGNPPYRVSSASPTTIVAGRTGTPTTFEQIARHQLSQVTGAAPSQAAVIVRTEQLMSANAHIAPHRIWAGLELINAPFDQAPDAQAHAAYLRDIDRVEAWKAERPRRTADITESSARAPLVLPEVAPAVAALTDSTKPTLAWLPMPERLCAVTQTDATVAPQLGPMRQIASNLKAWSIRDDLGFTDVARLSWKTLTSPPESSAGASSALKSVSYGIANFATGGYLGRRDERIEAFNEGQLSIYEYAGARKSDTVATTIGMLGGANAAFVYGAKSAARALPGVWSQVKTLASTAGLYWGVANGAPTVTQLAMHDDPAGKSLEYENATFSMVQALPFPQTVAVMALTLQDGELGTGFVGIGIGNSPGPAFRAPAQGNWEGSAPSDHTADYEMGLGLRYSVAAPIVGPLRTSEFSNLVTDDDVLGFVSKLVQGDVGDGFRPIAEPTIHYKLSEKKYGKVGGDPSYSLAIGIYRRPKSDTAP